MSVFFLSMGSVAFVLQPIGITGNNSFQLGLSVFTDCLFFELLFLISKNSFVFVKAKF